MREIKFRAWDTIEKGMWTVVGIEWHTDTVYLRDDTHCVQERMLHKMTLMQFTGLYDKNGKEIYENDVVKIALNRHDKPMCIRHVVWECGRWAVEVGNGDFVTLDSCPGGYISRNEVQVIGNIHENPHLIEVQ